MTEQRTSEKLQNLVRLVSTVILIIAVVRELRTPAEERTWRGQIGFVPYDLRPPTPSRVRAALWDPENPRLFVPQPFGVGWTVNLGRIWRLVTQR